MAVCRIHHKDRIRQVCQVYTGVFPDRRSLRVPANLRSRLCISQTSIRTKLCIS